MDETGEESEIDPCSINFVVQATPSDDAKQIIDMYLTDVFKCEETKKGNIQFIIAIRNPNQMIAEQKYSLTIRTTDNCVADCHVGFLRRFKTFSQLFERRNNGKYNNENAYYRINCLSHDVIDVFSMLVDCAV